MSRIVPAHAAQEPHGSNVKERGRAVFTNRPFFVISHRKYLQLTAEVILKSLKLLLPVLLLITALGCKSKEQQSTAAPARTIQTKLNVVLISLDTTRADAVGYYGNHEVDTHAIDALAKEGTTFFRHLSHVPLTLPSHTSMLTGKMPTGHGVHDNNGYRLSDKTGTVAQYFQQSGYKTAAFVSSVVLDHRYGLDRGFNVYDDHFPASSETGEISNERNAEATTQKAKDWLRANSGGAFFLFVHYYDPHAPYHPPAAYLSRFRNPYFGEISYVDDQIDQLLQSLQPVRSRTLIVVTADHGEGLGEHNELGHGLFLYDSTLHVPLILNGPAVPRGQRVSIQTGMCDLMPTILEMSGIKSPQGLDGRSLVPLMQGKDLTERPVISETMYPMQISWSPLFALSGSGRKYVEAPHPELYDVTKDAAERLNLLPQEKASAQPFAEKVRKYRTVALAGRKQETLDPDLQEQLRSLGYVSGSSGATNPDALPDPKDKIEVWKLFEQSTYLSMDGKKTEAAAMLQKAIKIDPGNAVLYDTLGRYFFDADPSGAARMWQKALALDPRNHTYHHKLAECLKKMGDPEKALQEETLALKIEPGMSEALLGASELLMQLNRPKDALVYLEQETKLDPKNATAAYQIGVAWRTLGDMQRAEESFRNAIDLRPELPYPYYELAILKGQAGDLQSAENLLQQAVGINPDFAEAYYNLAVIYEQTGRKPEAIRAYSDFITHARDPRLQQRVDAARSHIAALQ